MLTYQPSSVPSHIVLFPASMEETSLGLETALAVVEIVVLASSLGVGVGVE